LAICAYCGASATTYDHVVPKMHGGTNDPSNLVPACASCNSIVGKKLFPSFVERKKYCLSRKKILLNTRELRIEYADAIESSRPLRRMCRQCGRMSRRSLNYTYCKSCGTAY
jgi:thymidine kinase